MQTCFAGKVYAESDAYTSSWIELAACPSSALVLSASLSLDEAGRKSQCNTDRHGPVAKAQREMSGGALSS